MDSEEVLKELMNMIREIDIFVFYIDEIIFKLAA